MLASIAAGAASVPHLLLWKALARFSPPDSVRCAVTCTHTHTRSHSHTVDERDTRVRQHHKVMYVCAYMCGCVCGCNTL